MSRFHQILNRAYREILTEQDQPPVPPAPLAPEAAIPDQTTPTPIADVPENKDEQPKEILSPEGMVFLVRLLPKALMIDTLDTTEQAMLADLGDIDEYNAKEVLKKLIPIIQKYAPSSEKLPKV
jgi:hypothetical protein